MKATQTITALLIVVGGLNWGLVGFTGFDLVAALFGAATPVTRVVYSLVGISAVLQAILWVTPSRQTAAVRS